jgi:hypothetical protein
MLSLISILKKQADFLNNRVVVKQRTLKAVASDNSLFKIDSGAQRWMKLEDYYVDEETQVIYNCYFICFLYALNSLRPHRMLFIKIRRRANFAKSLSEF